MISLFVRKTFHGTRASVAAALCLLWLGTLNAAGANQLLDAPEKCAGLVVGALVGMPVAAARISMREEKYAVGNIDKGNQQARVRIPTQLFWAPFAVAAGVFQAPWVAFGNSYLNYNHPFSKAQFSIIDTAETSPTSPATPQMVRTPGEAEERR